MSVSQFFCTGCGHRLQPGKRFCTECGKPARVVAPSVPLSGSGSLPPGIALGGRWQVVRQLGKGGMGAVYLVQDTRLNNRRAALKEMLDRSLTIGAREEAIERFNREAETLASLSHANVPHIYDRFTELDRVYMVMEFVDGMDLERLLQRYREHYRSPLPEHVVARHTFQLCSVLEYLHRQNPPTLHRDLKPSNIVFQPNGLVKLIDFGIAKVFNPGSQGTGLGTQGYAAPEQYRGQAEPRTDIYALGATLHHLLTGRDPQLETPFDFPRIGDIVPCSAGFSEMVMAMLEMRPENRPATGELRRRLAELYPGIHEWEEDPHIMGLVGARPRMVTRQLQAGGSAPSPTPGPGFAQEAPRTPKFCRQCGAGLRPGAKFCTGCGNSVQVTAPQHPPAVKLQVPPAMAGSQPLELLAFDDSGEPFALLGLVQISQTQYAFVTPGSAVLGGAPIEVYVQVWKGSEAFFEPADMGSPAVVGEVQAAFAALHRES